MKIAATLIPIIVIILLCAVTGAFGLLSDSKIDITDITKGVPQHWHIFKNASALNRPYHPLSPDTGFPNLFTGQKVYGLHNAKRMCGDSNDCKWFTHDLATDRAEFWTENTRNDPRQSGLHMKMVQGTNVYLKGTELPRDYRLMQTLPYGCKGQCPRGFEWLDFEKICLLDDSLKLIDSRQAEIEKYPLCTSFN